MQFAINLARITRITVKMSAVALTIGLAACGGGGDTDGTGGGAQVNLVGAGASFPAPIYQRWFQDLSQSDPNLQVDYQSVGSGAGVERFTQELVDFGASDVAMTDEEIAQVGRGVILLPMTAGSIVLAYNLPDVSGLKLSREVYVDILLGKITNWNDPKIAAINPDITLPDQTITVVYRSDGSGTTGVFTKHLSAISPEWKEKVGEGKTVQWPVGIGGAKNDGVTAQIRQSEGAIGYVEYGFAKSAGLNMASLENSSGKYIEPTAESATATLEAVVLPENLRAFITDPEGDNSYPIVTYTWMLAYGQYDDAGKAQGIEKMIEFGLNEGQKISGEIGYIPLPDNVRQKVLETADKISPDYNMTLK
ncbi:MULTISPECIES: phosphate ABC transporter substrate-binding protein PstS [Okeania]|uniref:Phosphate-binding protein n=1 Tax=Okeania hirsuta TaxID=1458930 RepID=A0A3N6QDW0_9CYAN|nr:MULTISPECIES: phosphate ABC transporter substrate-binding protein PstS [Okeania]NES79426.1 phosphate ABC transporter substrate-binding protein PstS [Okeania sp. SIO1H4]NET23101.1 phosphate ABC transporter substrate-binding protein PstS [Okeania sp. SIO1H5]NET75737.1 phosphate ABC transporter substrate-binding protein PstS [Okeania sp. SIO1F9]NET96592.1 phosphate ABC transporter substrate-binding protein PstS [Okeania sp. SIO1H2]RQH34183.1 phosphate ABC transporter substrate-binding protein 